MKTESAGDKMMYYSITNGSVNSNSLEVIILVTLLGTKYVNKVINQIQSPDHLSHHDNRLLYKLSN